jgi:hypothetical protein
MIRKLTVALAATAVLGTAALAPSAANATWRGYGWYGHPYYSYPAYDYQPGYFVYKPHYVYPRYFHRWKHAGLLSLPLLIAAARRERRGPTATPVSREPGVGHLR